MEKLQNIGPVTEKQLKEVGINNYSDLKTLGSKEAWSKIKSIDPSS